MKKIIFTILIFAVGYQLFFNDSKSLQQGGLFNNKPTLQQEIQVEANQYSAGNLILINKETKLQADPTNLSAIPVDLSNNVRVDSEYLVHHELIEQLKKMFSAAAADGVNHFIINSAYRSGALQQQLYDENGSAYALPSGYSEHQTGLAIDIGSTQGTMDKAKEGKWLANNAANFATRRTSFFARLTQTSFSFGINCPANNAADFGFILRYPENKIDVTGIAFEPWHFRYVGIPHSLIMEKEGLVLEEYLDTLREEKELTIKVDGEKYFIQFMDNQDLILNSVKIPDTAKFTVSGDNLGGLIITSLIE